MFIYDITRSEEELLINNGLTIYGDKVSGSLDIRESDEPILKAYLVYLEYPPNRFILYVNNDSKLMKRLKDTGTDLLEGNLFIVALHTYVVYSEALKSLRPFVTLTNRLLEYWNQIEVQSSIREEVIPHLESVFNYTPTALEYQVLYGDTNYRVSIRHVTHENKDKYRISLPGIPYLYLDTLPTKQEVLDYIGEYYFMKSISFRGKTCPTTNVELESTILDVSSNTIGTHIKIYLDKPFILKDMIGGEKDISYLFQGKTINGHIDFTGLEVDSMEGCFKDTIIDHNTFSTLNSKSVGNLTNLVLGSNVPSYQMNNGILYNVLFEDGFIFFYNDFYGSMDEFITYFNDMKLTDECPHKAIYNTLVGKET